MKLYSAWYCPFAQRVWMSLLYKKVEFEYIEIDPYIETPEWLELSKGTAQVPVVVIDDENIVDSTLIMSQLDTLLPDTTHLFSTVPDERKKQEQWIDHINNKIVPYFYRYLKSHVEGKQKDEEERALLSGVTAFSEAFDPEGPYFSGEMISAVDFSLFPFAYRINHLLKHYRDFSLPISGDNWDRYQQWYNVMLECSEFKVSSTDIPNYEQRLIDVYYPYSQGGGQIDVTVTLED
jgi:glutathione S-transferase